MFKNTASQKLTVFAFADEGHATLDAGEPVTGDAANITLKIEQDDDGTQSASNDVNPTEVEDGQYRFDLTQAESNGDKLTFYPESSTAGVQVIALPSMVIYTRPANFTSLGINSSGHVSRVVLVDTTTTNSDMRGTDSALTTLGTNAPSAWINAAAIGADAITAAKVAPGAIAKGDQLTGLNDLDAAAIRTALGLASANVDTQLSGIATDAARLTAARAAVLTDLIDGGRLDLLIDAILADTNELQSDDIPASLAAIDTKIDTIDGIADAILLDTGTTIPNTLTTIDGIVDDILVDTGTTLPATLGTPTDTDLATDISNISAGSGLTQQQVADALKLAPTAGSPASGSAMAELDAILEDTGTTLPASIAAIDTVSGGDSISTIARALDDTEEIRFIFPTDGVAAALNTNSQVAVNETADAGVTGTITQLNDQAGLFVYQLAYNAADRPASGDEGYALYTFTDGTSTRYVRLVQQDVGGGGSSGSGTGARTVTITVDDGTTALGSATVRMTAGVNSFTATTNVSGVCTFNLDDASYTVAITKGGYTFAGTTLVVNGTEAETYSMTAISPAASGADFSTGYGYAYSEAGVVEAGVAIYAQIVTAPTGSGDVFDQKVRTATTDANGYYEFTGMARGGVYRVWRGVSRERLSVTVPDAASFAIGNFVGIDG
jgi:hypothetical protein